MATLPPGELYWRIDNFPALEQARSGAGEWALATESAGKVWLFTLGAAGGSSPGGVKVAEVGPIPRVAAAEYLLRINEASGPPGSVTPVHSHPGSEAFFVLAGEQSIRGAHGTMVVKAGQPEAGHGAGDGDAGVEQRHDRPARAGDVRGRRGQAVLVAGDAALSSAPAATIAAMSERPTATALSITAFATLLLIALLMGANHVAARVAFDHGVDVVTAVAVRSVATALVVGTLVVVQHVPVALTPRQRRFLPAIGVIVGVQSICLYSAVARLPVALALLAFNTYPLWTALWARLFYAHRPERRVVVAMPVMLLGLALALDVLGAASGLGAALQWQRIGAGVAFALAAAATFGVALVLTQHEAGSLDGRLRTTSTMAIVAVLALAGVAWQGGFHLA